jgi:hypothetical protein
VSREVMFKDLETRLGTHIKSLIPENGWRNEPMKYSKAIYSALIAIFFIVLVGCSPTVSHISDTAIAQEPTLLPVVNVTPSPDFSRFTFPKTIDPDGKYLFYLHGKIIEDQGIPAVSPDFGEYEYEAILEKFAGYGFTVISEPRPINTDGVEYAKKVANQVQALLDGGIPPENITVVGASKGGGIAIYASNLIGNPDVRYVIMAICSPEEIAGLKQSGISLSGRVLSIYDSADNLAGSCQELFDYSKGKGLSEFREVVLHVGTGHGILYQPLKEWVQPVVNWAQGKH